MNRLLLGIFGLLLFITCWSVYMSARNTEVAAAVPPPPAPTENGYPTNPASSSAQDDNRDGGESSESGVAIQPDATTPATDAYVADPKTVIQAGDSVEVEWSGTWYPATVVDVRNDGQCKIHYEGYGDDWDEVVGPDRIRANVSSQPVSQSSSRIQRVAKQHKITYAGWLNDVYAPENSLGEKKRHQLQCTLQFATRGDEREFQRGYLILGAFTYYQSGEGQSTTSDKRVEFKFTRKRDIVDFVGLLDELCTTPLNGDNHLKIQLEPSNPRDYLWSGGDPIEIAKSEHGYHFWNPGYYTEDLWGTFGPFEREWKKLDLFVLRETLARTAGEAGIAVPDPPVAMQEDLSTVGDKVWRMGE